MKSATKPTIQGSDKLINELDKALRAIFTKPQAQRPAPQPDLPTEQANSVDLNPSETQTSIELMRINHTGEVCAQALYQGQAMTARSSEVKNKMHEAALEEIDHLNWCETRLDDLGGRTSYLNPVWYMGSLSMGAIAGLLGDKWSLGFLQETEIQVEKHLAEHLEKLPEHDYSSRAIVAQMKIDEAQHAEMAAQSGAAELPTAVKFLMNRTADLMKVIVTKI